jgi:hypothetical protein
LDEGRRSFTLTLGALVLAPAVVESALQEIRASGTVSRETVQAALQLTGDTMTEAELEQARTTLESRLKEFEAIRSFPVPPGLEPAIQFKAR